jgi:hypothetical protein
MPIKSAGLCPGFEKQMLKVYSLLPSPPLAGFITGSNKQNNKVLFLLCLVSTKRCIGFKP